MTSSITVIGEALIEEIRDGYRVERRVGGSPLNVAVGTARLGVPTTFVTAIGADRDGETIAEHLKLSGVTLDAGGVTASPTGRAIARVGPGGAAEYEFAVDWVPDLSRFAANAIVHTGSLGAWLSPGAEAVQAALVTARSTSIVSFDPNIRPSLIADATRVHRTVDDLVALSTIVKLSDEDANWLYPGVHPRDVCVGLIESGAALAAVTLGESGAIVATRYGVDRIPAPKVHVVDTVGAGDTFMAALLFRVAADGLEAVIGDPVAAVRFAVEAAAITIGRVGADLPWAADLAV
ncbi:MAG: carbohydrate kinase [Protaetiibacter sp.]